MNDQDLNLEIEKALDEDVRPYLQSHNGDVRVDRIEDGIVYVEMLGACGDCSMANATNEGIIKNSLAGRVPGVKDVVLVSHYDEDLLVFAKEVMESCRSYWKEQGMPDPFRMGSKISAEKEE